MIPLIGSLAAEVVYLLNVYYWGASADYILLSAIYSLFGGNTTFLIGLYSYLADITTPDTRTSRSLVPANCSSNCVLSAGFPYWM